MRYRGTTDELRAFLRRLGLLIGAITALIAAGTLGYWATSDLSIWDSFLEAMDTIATIGSTPPPQETGAEIVKVVLITLGVGTLFYALVTVTEAFVAGHLAELLDERRSRRMIESLSDHFIICGFGRVGRQVARDLRAAGAKYVVVDGNPDNQAFATEVGVRFLAGDAGEDEVLRTAGIQRARAVLACVDSDADNIFITLSARGLRDDIEIIARASVEDSERKLLRAGADRVVSPYKSSGAEMARFALHPQVTGVVDVSPEYRLEEIEVSPGCSACGHPLGELAGEAVVVGVRRGDGVFVPQPPRDLIVDPGDVLVAMGTVETMDRLETLFDAPAQRAATSA
jgi:voltage-gated potassium channel